MAKFDLRIKARELRRRGVSIREITRILGVSKSSTSRWVKDIILTLEQLESLRGSMLDGAERGRLKTALLKRQKRSQAVEEANTAGRRTIPRLNKRELLIAGLALYWGEGSKKSNRGVSFCNSDPGMIKFLMRWLIECFGVAIDELRCRVGINLIHYKRDKIVKKYWSEVTNIPLEQFRNTSFKKVKNKKVYENFNEHYGTLTVEVAKSWNLYYKILGLITGLQEAV